MFCDRDGEEWRTNRIILNKYLLRQNAVKKHVIALNQIAEDLVSHWAQSETNEVNHIIKNLEQSLYRWSLESKYRISIILS